MMLLVMPASRGDDLLQLLLCDVAAAMTVASAVTSMMMMRWLGQRLLSPHLIPLLFDDAVGRIA